MSHFLEIINLPTQEYYGFGKAVSRSYDVFPDVTQAAVAGELELFHLCFPSAAEGWGVDPVGSRRLYDWIRRLPEDKRNLVLHCDANDAPYYAQPPTGWWACIGSLYRPDPLDMWGVCGYLATPRSQSDQMFYGSMTPAALAELRHQIHHKRHPPVPSLPD